jgi:CheY-like chemotaxis protein
MHQTAELIRSVASLLWPLAVIGITIFVLPTLRSALGKSDSINIEIAGTKVSLQRASEEVRKLIDDLQNRVNQLESTLDGGRNLEPLRRPDVRRRILWVDDRIEANVYERARLEDAHYRVMQAESTNTALRLLRSQDPFDVIISDMGRVEESGRLNPRAGLDLLSQIRASGDPTPVVFYTSQQGIALARQELEGINDVAYTTSPSELMKILGIS